MSSRCVAFRSQAFNTTVERDYFINPCCFGDDVARWLISALRAKGHATDEQPVQEDFGWFLTSEFHGVRHRIIIVYIVDSNPNHGEWFCWVERAARLAGAILPRHKQVFPESIETLHEILISSPFISNVRPCPELPRAR